MYKILFLFVFFMVCNKNLLAQANDINMIQDIVKDYFLQDKDNRIESVTFDDFKLNCSYKNNINNNDNRMHFPTPMSLSDITFKNRNSFMLDLNNNITTRGPAVTINVYYHIVDIVIEDKNYTYGFYYLIPDNILFENEMDYQGAAINENKYNHFLVVVSIDKQNPNSRVISRLFKPSDLSNKDGFKEFETNYFNCIFLDNTPKKKSLFNIFGF